MAYTIYAKETKEVPEWMRSSHEWQTAVPVDKLPKYQLKMKLCCLKCEEKVIEEIREVDGVFDVRAERQQGKVVVVASTLAGVDEHEVLKKAKTIHRKAKFVELDAKEKAKKGGDDDKKKEEEKKKKEKEEAEKKKKEEAVSGIYTFKPFEYWGAPPYYTYGLSPYMTELDAKEKAKKGGDDDKKKEDEKKKEKEEAEKKKKEAESIVYTYKPLVHWGASPYYIPGPAPFTPGEYRPSQNYAPRYYYPPLPGQSENGSVRQYVYHY